MEKINIESYDNKKASSYNEVTPNSWTPIIGGLLCLNIVES